MKALGRFAAAMLLFNVVTSSIVAQPANEPMPEQNHQSRRRHQGVCLSSLPQTPIGSLSENEVQRPGDSVSRHALASGS